MTYEDECWDLCVEAEDFLTCLIECTLDDDDVLEDDSGVL